MGRLDRATETIALLKLRPDHDRSRTLAAAASEISRGGGLWLGLSALAATSSRTRIAGLHGVLAWAAGSASAFGLKRLTRRSRPRLVRRIGSPPESSSMPSSQAAGAIAYATAATWQAPAAGIVAVPLALSVVWSRSATGRHFPTDVAAGAVLGLATGTLVHLALGRRSRASGQDGEAPATLTEPERIGP